MNLKDTPLMTGAMHSANLPYFKALSKLNDIKSALDREERAQRPQPEKEARLRKELEEQEKVVSDLGQGV